jgi:SAM-dependent methyltransferase
MTDPVDPAFRTDLYRGTAGAYDRFRPPYPAALIADLITRTGADGTGRLLDLACGTGQAALAMASSFAEIWAVDQEPDMIEFARHKVHQAGTAARFRFLTCAAEDLAAPAGHFDLITVGNAFHRLRRTVLAPAMLGWLRPHGFVALLWGGSPSNGAEPWQRVLAATMQRWQDRPGAEARIPADYQPDRDAHTDVDILTGAGFITAGRYDFPTSRLWTADELAGYLASTSVLSAAALGEHTAEFDDDLHRQLSSSQPDGRFRQRDVMSYDLARRPG